MTHPIAERILSRLTNDGFSDDALAELAAQFRLVSREPQGVSAVYETIAFLTSGPAPKAGQQLTDLVVKLLGAIPPSTASGTMTGREHPFARFGGSPPRVSLNGPRPEGSVSATSFAIPRRI